MRKKVAFLILVVALCVQIQGEPTPTVSWLMNEPVSLWDWGIIRLEDQINKYFERSKSSAYVDYDWDENVLRIRAHHSFNEDESAEHDIDREKAVNTGKLIAEGIRECLSVNGETGAPYFETSFLYLNFGHEGFQRANRPENLARNLDAITEIRITVFFYEKGELDSVHMFGKLLSNRVYIDEK